MLGKLELLKKLKKKNLIIGAIGAGVVLFIVAVNLANSTDVTIELAQKGTLQERIELRGKVQLDAREKVFSRLSGTIQNIVAKEGDSVEVNSVLAKLDVQDLNLELGKAQEAYNAAKAAAEEYKTSTKPEDIRQAQAQVQQGSIALESALKDYHYKVDKLEKIRSLHRDGGASAQELKDAELMVTAAEGVLKDARQRLEIEKSNLSRIQKGVSEYGVDAKEAHAEQARLQVEELKTSLGRTSFYSGMKGIVLAKHVEKGDFIQPGTLLYEIGDNSSAFIRVDVLSDDAEKIKVGQKAIITGEILKDKEYSGEVFFIAPRAETKVSTLGIEQQRVEVRIKYDNTAIQLKSGYGVDVKIIAQEKQNTVFVPDKAVFDLEGEDGVFTIKNGKLVLKPVKTGIENDDFIEILEGVSEGDQIVVDPDNKLKPGLRVK
ncbi:MAG: efflux RND transporter periplasmic adaptor subunit [Clostridia bacterium]|nr:efflux RND transporter periplasmic adaptor subunit [Clostridia bacterium]